METGVVWELITPAGTLVFDPFGQESSLGLNRIDGMAGAEMRSQVTALPQGDGAIVFSAFRGARYPILEGFVRTLNDLSARRLTLDQIVAYTDSIRRTDGTLRWTPTGAPQRECTVRLYDRVQISAGEGVRKEFQIALVSADPRVYSSALHSAEAFMSAGTDTTGGTGGSGPRRHVELSIQNAGTTPTPPIISVYGPCVAPTVYLVGSNPVQYLWFPNLTVAAGDYVYIDCGRELIVKNAGTESLIGFLDVPNATFFQIPIGTWGIGLDASQTGWTSATKLHVDWRDAYI